MRLHLTAILSGALLFATALHAATRTKPGLVCVGDDDAVTAKLCAALAQRLGLKAWSQDPTVMADLRVEVLQALPTRLSARLGTRSAKGYAWRPEVTTTVMDADSLPASAFADLARGLEASLSLDQSIKLKR